MRTSLFGYLDTQIMDTESSWPTLEDANCYNNAKQVYVLAEADRAAAKGRARIFWEARDKHEKNVLLKKSVAEKLLDEAVEGRRDVSSMARECSRFNAAIQSIRDRIDNVRAFFVKISPLRPSRRQ